MDNMMFNYIEASQNFNIPENVLKRFVGEARREFPRDPMLMELHVLRAVNAYAASKKKVAEN